MKKFYLCLLFSLLVVARTFSQDSLRTSNDPLKVTAGHVTMELNINPFRGDLSLNNALNQIKIRYFTSDNFAIRLGFNVETKKKETTVTNPYGTNPFISDETKKFTGVGVNVGVEKHFTGTKRLSPFIAAEFSFGTKFSNYTLDDGNVKTKIEGAWRSTTMVNNAFVYGYEERGYVKYGLSVLAGFDFYVAKNFFLGYEAALQFSNIEYTDIDITTTGSSFPPDSPDSKETEISFAPVLLNGIRIGYVF